MLIKGMVVIPVKIASAARCSQYSRSFICSLIRISK